MYTLVNGQPPAEADMQRFFEVTPPSVHRMVMELEARGLIRRIPRQPRSIEVTVSPRRAACPPTDQNLCGGVLGFWRESAGAEGAVDQNAQRQGVCVLIRRGTLGLGGRVRAAFTQHHLGARR
jgi:hypothetical protein